MIADKYFQNIIEEEYLKGTYGLFEINYDKKRDLYLLYGYRNSDYEWFHGDFDFLYATRDHTLINYVEEQFPVIRDRQIFCKECLRSKNIDAFIASSEKGFSGIQLWRETPKYILKTVQNLVVEKFGEILDERYFKFGVEGRNVPAYAHPYCESCVSKLNIYSKEYETLQKFNEFVETTFKIEISKEIMNRNEYFLRDFLMHHHEYIEEGLTFIDKEFEFKDADGRKRRVDLLFKDANGQFVIVELKVVNDCSKLLQQAAFYQSHFPKGTRTITIAPNYKNSIYVPLSYFDFVEIKQFKLNKDGCFHIEDFKATTSAAQNNTFITKNVNIA